jgi:hypothetical protein
LYFGGTATDDYEILSIDVYGNYIAFAGHMFNQAVSPETYNPFISLYDMSSS